MADASAFGKPTNKYKQDMEAMVRGANALKPQAPIEQPNGVIGDIENDVSAAQAHNAADPAIQDKLNKIAALRAAYYAKGAPSPVDAAAQPAPIKPTGPEVYPAMEPRGRR